MAPIRTAIVGLSQSASVSWASVAHLPYLLSPRGRSKFTITALCNTSVESAKRAVAAFNLPPETKTYGDTAALAADPDIDLVVCNVRVDRHYEIIRPSIDAGKAVYCEWPLAQDLEHASELAKLARERGARTMIGTQGRVAPLLVKLRELLQQGRIGKILSSEVRAAGGSNDRAAFPSFMDYFTDRKVGGNIVTIGLGHLMDSVQFAIGDFTDIKSTLQIQRPYVPIQDRETKSTITTLKSDVPDLVIVTGKLAASPIAQQGATLSIRFRRGQSFPDEAPLVWTISGEKGEIRFTSPGGTALQATAYAKPVVVEVHDFATDAVEQVIEWDWAEWQKDLPMVARNVGSLYEAFAEGDTSRYPTFEDALKRHEQLDTILAGWQPDKA
ncbi:hypothetical protein S7711_09358 [Stachybotrys chartarum IBT 7711]|uniref:Uncharacterized protein n=1 Tax=Stachybotrys chartarum (strain CBS 109288 / IBT 7711) TaxID=1280523 RepID=A0A084AYK5_STACB|nr:hypothetical protein S7711_09358 [Stachybotrys chartarum IBT 7711]